MTRIGVCLYGIASAAAGIMDLVWGDFDSSHQPIQAFGDHIPGREVLAYVTGVWMIAGGAATLWRRSARAGAVALAIIYFIFAVFWLPRFYTAPYVLGFHIPVMIGVLGGAGTQLIVAAAGALVYASLATNSSSWARTILAVRWIFGLCSIDFGLGHLTDIKNNVVYVPKWMPLGAEFWTILTGICFVLAGLAILSRIQERPGCPAACADVLGFQPGGVAAFHFCLSQGPYCLGRQRVQLGCGGGRVDIG